MNKNEQNRVVAWRLKLLRQASEMPRVIAQTCRHLALSRSSDRPRLADQATVRLQLQRGDALVIPNVANMPRAKAEGFCESGGQRPRT